MASYIIRLLFLVGFNIGVGSIVPIYTAEVVTDKASGFCAGGQFGVALIWTLTMKFMIHRKLQAFGTFLLFGSKNLLGFFYSLL